MKNFLNALGVGALLGLSLLFAYLNSGQRVTLRLGVATLYGVPLTAIAFGSVISGMVIMLVAGIRSDMKVRRILRARLAEEDREERDRFVDHDQQDLFDGLPAMAAATPLLDSPSDPPTPPPLQRDALGATTSASSKPEGLYRPELYETASAVPSEVASTSDEEGSSDPTASDLAPSEPTGPESASAEPSSSEPASSEPDDEPPLLDWSRLDASP